MTAEQPTEAWAFARAMSLVSRTLQSFKPVTHRSRVAVFQLTSMQAGGAVRRGSISKQVCSPPQHSLIKQEERTKSLRHVITKSLWHVITKR